MLQAIRDRASGVFAWIIVSLLIIPFAFWGIHSYFGGGRDVNVAKINDTEISKEQLLDQFESRIQGSNQRPEGAQALQLKKNILDQMVNEELLIQAATEAGYRISDAQLIQEIHAMQIFKTDGKFDQERYQRLLQDNRLSSEQFENGRRRELLIQQYVSGFVDSEFVTNAEIDEYSKIQDRQLEVAFFTIPKQTFLDKVKPTDEEIAEYYKKNSANYMTEEQVKLQYLKLDVAEIEPTIEVNDETLRQVYEEQKTNYRVAEQREGAHILVTVDADADEAKQKAAEAKAKEAYDKVKAGESFAEVAKAYSDDPGSAEQGGSLGVLERGSFDKDFEEVAFKLKEGEVSEPVKTSFGWHVIKITKIKPESQKSFEEAKAEVEAEYRKTEAEALFYDRSETLYDLTYENPETLEIAARELNLKIQESDWISRSGGKDEVTRNRRVMTAAFSEDVLAGGNLQKANNSKLIELDDTPSAKLHPQVVFRIKEYKAPRQKTLDEVKDVIKETLRQQQATKQLREAGTSLLEKARASKDIAKLASEKNYKLEKPGFIGRNESKVDRTIVSTVFSKGKPSADAPIIEGVSTSKGDYAIVAATQFKDPDLKSVAETERKTRSSVLENIANQATIQAVLKQLKQDAEVEIYEENLSQDNEA